MKNIDVSRRWKPLAGIATVLALAWIVIAQAPNVINGCVGPGGSLKIVSGGSACKQNEQPISWNIQGPPGVAGPTGAMGATGATGATGPTGPSDAYSTLAVSPVLSAGFGSEVTIATLTAPAGSYVTLATLSGLHVVGAATNVTCFIENASGSAMGSGKLDLAPGLQQTLSFHAAGILSTAGTLNLRCNNTPNVSADSALLTATRVGNLHFE